MMHAAQVLLCMLDVDAAAMVATLWRMDSVDWVSFSVKACEINAKHRRANLHLMTALFTACV